jgi:structure-specific recognition protein 1
MMAMEESEARIFDNITLNGQSLGVLKVHSGGISWKGKETARIINCNSRDIQDWKWLRTTAGCQLRVEVRQTMENGIGDENGHKAPESSILWKFDGLRDQDIESLSGFIGHRFRMSLAEMPFSLKGWNWGEVDLKSSASDLIFKQDGKQIFELPMFEVVNCGLSGKNEVSIEFRTDDSREIRDDSLVEIRFYVPGTVEAENGSRSLAEVGQERHLLYALMIHIYFSKWRMLLSAGPIWV